MANSKYRNYVCSVSIFKGTTVECRSQSGKECICHPGARLRYLTSEW